MKRIKLSIYTSRRNGGLTVIELLVTTGIIIVILGLVLTGYPAFKAKSALAALAREVGLLVREAQVYGLAVKDSPRQASSGGVPYGIHINEINNKEIILYSDLETGAHPLIYDSGDGCGSLNTECVKRFTLSGPVFISNFCVIPEGGLGGNPKDLEELCDITEVNINFKRPDPEALIVVDDADRQYNGATIYLKSTKDSEHVKVVRVWITGQISVQ